MKIKNITGVILLGAMLSVGFSSCQFTNKYKTPEVDSDALFRDQISTDTTTIANIPWRHYFTDATLQNLIQEGLNNNHDLRATVENIKMAEAGLSVARAAYFPDVALVANANHSRSSANMLGQDKDVLGYHNTQYTLGVAVSWEADIWGKMNRQSRAKYAQFLQSHSYRNLVQTSLIANIATSYYALMALDEQLEITKKTIALMGETTETMQALKDAGLLTGASVEQSKGLLYGTMISINDLETEINKLENTMSLLLGRKPGFVHRSTLQAQYVPAQLKVGIPVQMLSKRPDVMNAELSFRSAFELKYAAKASFYPTIALSSGTIGYGAASLSSFFKPEHIFANIVGGLTQPLFARKQLIANLKVAEAQQNEALIRFEQAVLNASQEVSTIIYSYEASLRKNENRAKQVKALDTAVDYTKQLLVAGEANYTEVLNAEQSLLQAELGEVSDKLEQLQYSVNLYRSLGGGTDE